MKAYQNDLAFIHDQGFSAVSLQASTFLPSLFRRNHVQGKRIVELGCGPGQLAQELTQKGFTVAGIDYSPAMISLAKRNAPHGHFRAGSIWSCRIPRVDAVVAVGEVLNYQFDGEVNLLRLRKLFGRIFESLSPGGLFIFDILCERKSGKTIRTKSFVEGKGWFVAVEKTDSSRKVVRHIISFRDVGGGYRKCLEVHRVRRHNLSPICTCLRDIGFTVSTFRGYGTHPLGKGHVVVVGKKRVPMNGMCL